MIAEEGFEHLDAPVIRLAGPDVPGVPFHHSLEDWFMIPTRRRRGRRPRRWPRTDPPTALRRSPHH